MRSLQDCIPKIKGRRKADPATVGPAELPAKHKRRNTVPLLANRKPMSFARRIQNPEGLYFVTLAPIQ